MQCSVAPVRCKQETALDPPSVNFWLLAHLGLSGDLCKALFPLCGLVLPIPHGVSPTPHSHVVPGPGITEPHTMDSKLVATEVHLYIQERVVPRAWLFGFRRTSKCR